MSIFCYKKLDPASRSGAKLHDARIALSLSIEYISERTHIQKKYLQALEENNFSILPKAKAYRLAYVKEFATWVGLDPKAITEQFIGENGLENAPVVHPHQKIRWTPFSSLSVLARNLIFLTMALVFTGYLVWQVHGVLEPPRLAVFSPAEGYIANQSSIMLEGETESEAQLTVNGQTITVNDSGAFQTKVDLLQGVNTLVITATKKHGKSFSITRHLVMDDRMVNEDKVSLK